MRDIEITFDRRTIDVDGRMHVVGSVLTAAQTNPYMGIEIPGMEALGLDPSRVYMLYRDPVALRAAVPLFENLPILLGHVAISARDPKQEMICGSVSNARWQDGKILGDLALWTAEAIDLVESNQKRDLSVGYHYVCRMTPGVAPDGTRFDGSMSEIQPNHLAIVPEGRVTGAYVADAALDLEIEFDMQSAIFGYTRLR